MAAANVTVRLEERKNLIVAAQDRAR
jgi:hypothetical protein